MSCNIFCPLTQPHRTPHEDHFGTSYQQWLSSAEVRGQGSQERHTLPPHDQNLGYQDLTLDDSPIPMGSQLTALPRSCPDFTLPSP